MDSGWDGRARGPSCPSLLSRCGLSSSRPSGPVVVAHPLLDVVQLGLQILRAALLHPVIWRLWRGGNNRLNTHKVTHHCSRKTMEFTFLRFLSLLYSSRASCYKDKNSCETLHHHQKMSEAKWVILHQSLKIALKNINKSYKGRACGRRVSPGTAGCPPAARPALGPRQTGSC